MPTTKESTAYVMAFVAGMLFSVVRPKDCAWLQVQPVTLVAMVFVVIGLLFFERLDMIKKWCLKEGVAFA